MGLEASDKHLVVFKIGSSTLVDSTGAPDRAFIHGICDQIADLVRLGHQVILVSSGAAAAGIERLHLDSRPKELPALQACCAAGQAALTEIYAEALAEHGIPCGQVLLTRFDVVNRTSYLNVRNTFDCLLEYGAVPVVNENDTVSPVEFGFSDNDNLGAIVSVLVGADLYVILSDVDGMHEADPTLVPNSPLIERITHIDRDVIRMAGDANSKVGTGGMAAKVRAARAVLTADIPMFICQGRAENALLRAVEGTMRGTLFEPEGTSSHENARKLWIGLAGVSRGSIVIDPGAERALVADGASLLPVGVREVQGTFAEGDVVSVVNADGELLGRGIVRYSSEEMEKIRGLRSDVIARFLPEKADQPCVHRDELLVF